MATFVNNTEFVVEDCCNCGMQFAMTRDFYRRVYADHSTFHCPKGHPQHYTGKTEEQKLKEKLEEARRENERTRQALEAESGRATVAVAQLNEVKRSASKMRQRIKNGVCPCCNRSFENLMNHMKHQHPEFGKAESLKAVRDIFGLSQSALAREIGVKQTQVSQFETGKPVVEHAKRAIESWMERQA